jgi:ATP-dependent RNA helicase RhlE
VIIFCSTKENAEGVFKIVKRKAEGEIRILHSNKAQSSRINAINAFKKGEVRVLISTDVSARGLDVSKISHVINFDLPSHDEDYVHRIGRTARASNHGVAISMVNLAEEFQLRKIEELIRMEIPLEELPENFELVESSRREKQNQDREIDRQKRLADPTFKGAFHEKKYKKTKSNFKFNSKSKRTRGKKMSKGKR